jgi:hypothetical protein
VLARAVIVVVVVFRRIIIIIIIIIIMFITFIQSTYNYTPEAKKVSRVHSVAAVIYL